MDQYFVDHRRLGVIADEVQLLASRLDVLFDNHYLRNAARLEKSGSQVVVDACGDFENEWSFGRDRLHSKMSSIAEFLHAAASEYATVDATLAGDAAPDGGGASSGLDSTG